MKRLIAAAMLAVIVAVIHFTGNIYIKKVIKECEVQLETIVTDYKKDISPKEHADKLKKYWAENEDYLRFSLVTIILTKSNLLLTL